MASIHENGTNHVRIPCLRRFGRVLHTALRLVCEWRRRPMLPVGQHIPVTVRHFDLGQRLSVEDLILRNNTVFVEQEGGQGIDLVRCQRALLSEWHTAIDVIPYRGRVWRVDAHYRVVPDTRRETRRRLAAWRGSQVFGSYQLRSPSSVPGRAVACRTLLGIERRTFF